MNEQSTIIFKTRAVGISFMNAIADIKGKVKKDLTVIEKNRAFYLAELRSGKYVKGTIISDEKTGKPLFPDGVCEGSCACAIMHDLFFEYEGEKSSRNYLKALGLTPKQCRFIQQKLNDTELSFNEIADEIESKIFF